MATIGSVASGLVPQGSSIGLLLLIGTMAAIVLAIVCFIAFVTWNRRRWNLQVEIKLPRSDGRMISAEWGKGYFNSSRGVVFIKRPGFMQPKIPLKIFDPKRYLQGDRLITVVQLSPVDYRPVLPESYLECEIKYTCDRNFKGNESFFDKFKFINKDKEVIKNLKKGDVVLIKESILNVKCDEGASKAWVQAFDAASKQAYSLKSFLQQFQTPIAIAIVLVAVFVGIAALWTQMPK